MQGVLTVELEAESGRTQQMQKFYRSLRMWMRVAILLALYLPVRSSEREAQRQMTEAAKRARRSVMRSFASDFARVRVQVLTVERSRARVGTALGRERRLRSQRLEAVSSSSLRSWAAQRLATKATTFLAFPLGPRVLPVQAQLRALAKRMRRLLRSPLPVFQCRLTR